MPKGFYERKPKATTVDTETQANPFISQGAVDAMAKVMLGDDTSAKAHFLPPDAKPPAAVSLAGRAVYRIMLHNGVHLGLPPNSRVERMIMAKDAPWSKPQGRPVADVMTLTPVGVYVRFPGEIEKLIPFANIYEADLAP